MPLREGERHGLRISFLQHITGALLSSFLEHQKEDKGLLSVLKGGERAPRWMDGWEGSPSAASVVGTKNPQFLLGRHKRILAVWTCWFSALR